MIEIEEKQKQRFLFLNYLYDSVSGIQDSPINMYEVGNYLGFDIVTINNIVKYLQGEGLVNNSGYGGTITGLVAITHKGIKEVDQAFKNPNAPTSKFPAHIVYNITGDYVGGDNYSIKDIGPNARIQQGKQQNWTEILNTIPNSNTLEKQFKQIISEISKDKMLNRAEKSISLMKTESIAKALANAQRSPEDLHYALIDGNNWFSNKANWVWKKLIAILESEAAQKTIGTITESGIRGAIKTFIG